MLLLFDKLQTKPVEFNIIVTILKFFCIRVSGTQSVAKTSPRLRFSQKLRERSVRRHISARQTRDLSITSDARPWRVLSVVRGIATTTDKPMRLCIQIGLTAFADMRCGH